MATNKRYRIGMDSGGTFTDIVVLDFVTKEWKLYKILSKHDHPALVLHAALEKASAGEDMSVADFVDQTDMLVIGTTVATNALLQHRGAKVGLLTTAGHEDTLEIREGHKDDGHRYDWYFEQAKVLSPGNLRVGIRERVLYDGSVYSPIELDDVRAAAERFAETGVEAISVCFLWSFMNADHEKQAIEILRERLPDVPITASHELLPLIGDYHRVSTVVLNSYVQPVVARFVRGMEKALEEVGFEGPVRYFQANGGMSRADNLIEKAIYALNSGPAAAPTGGSMYSSMYGADAITIDAGGTSLDIGLVRNGSTETTLTSDVARYKVGVPMVSIETLGAGGGSIGWFNDHGILSVGPQSAESKPGPSCYNLGGTDATVTDALVALGWFPQDALLGGGMPIKAENAFAAIGKNVAEPGGISTDEAADGIIKVCVNNMVGGIRRISVERGYDTRDAVLVGIGGSGPAVACWIADDLEMDTVIIPRVASGFCAFGAALSEVRYDYMGTFTADLATADLEKLNAMLAGMEQNGIDELVAEGHDPSTLEIRRSFEMRYIDQIHNCMVPVSVNGTITDDDLSIIREAFDSRHEDLFTYREPENTAILTNVHTTVVGNSMSTRLDEVFRPSVFERASDLEPKYRSVYTAKAGERVDARIWRVDEIDDSATVVGPAVIEEVTTTIVVPDGWAATLDPRGHYEINRMRAAEASVAA